MARTRTSDPVRAPALHYAATERRYHAKPLVYPWPTANDCKARNPRGALAALVFLIVLIVGFAKNGIRFLKLFVPQGVPVVILPLVVLIEIISFLSRPVSHSVRLFANMLAGHITLKVFGGFVVMLLGAGTFAALSPLPLLMAIALTALEVLVAFLQAYVFAMLTCIYLNDALHPGH